MMTDIRTSNEAQIAAMLNIYEYLDYHMGTPGTTFERLVREADEYLRKKGPLDEEKEQLLNILNQGIEFVPGLADLRLELPAHSENPCERGIEADAFVSGGNDVYVVYRGTGDGKWIDNGRGMTRELTSSQSQASDYFDRVVNACGVDEDTNLIVTGHSKGGNNAQSVTLNARNRDLIDTCISFDGQGMSDAAIERYHRMPGYEDQINKMYAINGENDVVNELGIKVIPDDHTVYIETNADTTNLIATHAMQYLFHREDGSFGYTFNEESSQGELGQYAHRLSELLMRMPEDMRDSCAVSIMQLIELPEELKIGYDGDHASLSDLSAFLRYGLPTVIYSIIGTEEGRDALCVIFKDLVENAIDKYGVWGTLGIVTGTLLVSPVVMPVLFSFGRDIVAFMAGITAAVGVLAAIEKLGTYLEQIKEGIQKCLAAVEEFFDKIGDWIRSRVTGRPIIDDADFSVNIEALRYAADELGGMRQILLRASSKVGSVKRSLPIHGLAAGAVKMYLNYVALSLYQVSGRAGLMERAANRMADTYVNYERRIMGNAG